MRCSSRTIRSRTPTGARLAQSKPRLPPAGAAPGLSLLASRSAPRRGAPPVAGLRLRTGRGGCGRGAGSTVTEAVATARVAGATGQVLVRGDSAYGAALWSARPWPPEAQLSVVLTQNPGVHRAGAPSRRRLGPRCTTAAVVDPDTGELISGAEVAEVAYTTFASTDTPVTAQLVVRRVKDRNQLAELFPVRRHHPLFISTEEATVDADITHRPHATVETVFSDLIDGPLAHPPALGAVRRQRRLGDLRRHQPAPSMPWPEAPPCAARIAQRSAGAGLAAGQGDHHDGGCRGPSARPHLDQAVQPEPDQCDRPAWAAATASTAMATGLHASVACSRRAPRRSSIHLPTSPGRPSTGRAGVVTRAGRPRGRQDWPGSSWKVECSIRTPKSVATQACSWSSIRGRVRPGSTSRR